MVVKEDAYIGDLLKGHYLKKKFSSHLDLTVAMLIQG